MPRVRAATRIEAQGARVYRRGMDLAARALADPDNRVFLHQVSWEQYEAILAIRGDDPSPKLMYLDGELELMSPSRTHEWVKTTLARLLEAWADERGVAIEGYGGMTMRRRRRMRGLEPDECYVVGEPKKTPDLAIEVIWTSGGIEKLDIYRGLGVREVWRWEDGVIEVWVLRGGAYVRRPASAVLPDVDLALLARLLEEPTQTAAVRQLRATLRRT